MHTYLFGSISAFLFGMFCLFLHDCFKSGYWRDLNFGLGLLALSIVSAYGAWRLHQNAVYITELESIAEHLLDATHI
jgi:hypothetical protein